MRAKREYRDRGRTQVAVLDALVERSDDGMTVFELRAAVSVEIDELETALANLKDDDLIVVSKHEGRTVIKPADRVVPTGPSPEDRSFVDWVRERIPF
ncbi:DUF6432 family protein [Halovivax sp.]|uniref:DUF6432 family protein n=1 Tax=Halovivax sp. TaxID=1935978 RepID=UPI0025BD4662|nr:DUF6432 family protein [Halovivax sp.]